MLIGYELPVFLQGVLFLYSPAGIKRKAKSGAYAFLASYMNGMTMGFYNVFTDGQAKATSTYFSSTSFACPEKTFKYPVKIFFCNAHTVITDLYQNIPVICIIHTGNC